MAVEKTGEVRVSIYAVEQLVRDVVTSVVSAEIVRSPWSPPLFFSCSEVCWKVRKELSGYGIGCRVRSGHWTGEVDGVFAERLGRSEATRMITAPFKHDWVEVSHAGSTVRVDPTFVQFVSANTSWSFEMCLQAARWCQL